MIDAVRNNGVKNRIDYCSIGAFLPDEVIPVSRHTRISLVPVEAICCVTKPVWGSSTTILKQGDVEMDFNLRM